MPPEDEDLGTELEDDEALAGATIVAPSLRASRPFVLSAIADKPWAIKRSRFAAMLRADEFALARPDQRPEPEAASNFERIGGQMVASAAVLPVHGVITQRYDFWSWLFGGTSIDLLRNALREVIADPAVGAVILDIDSPGGSVDGLTEFSK